MLRFLFVCWLLLATAWSDHLSDQLRVSFEEAAARLIKAHEGEETPGQDVKVEGQGLDFDLLPSEEKIHRSKRSTNAFQLHRWMHSFAPFTGIGNRERLTLEEIREQYVIWPRTPIVDAFDSFEVIRFNSSNYFVARRHHSALVWRSPSSLGGRLDLSRPLCTISTNGVIERSLTYATENPSRLKLALAIGSSSGRSLRVHDLNEPGCSSAHIVQLQVPSPILGVVHLVSELRPEGGLFLLNANPTASRPQIQQISSSSNAAMYSIGANGAIDVSGFQVNGVTYLAIGYSLGVDIYRFDEFLREYFFQQHIRVDYLLDLEVFRVGVDSFLGVVSGSGIHSLFEWRDGVGFVRLQFLTAPSAVQWKTLSVANCRDDAILLLVAPRKTSVWLWNPQTRHFEPKSGLPTPTSLHTQLPSSQATFARRSVAFLLMLNERREPRLLAFRTSLSPVADPIIEQHLRITEIMRSLVARISTHRAAIGRFEQVLPVTLKKMAAANSFVGGELRSLSSAAGVIFNQLEALGSLRTGSGLNWNWDQLRFNFAQLRGQVSTLRTAIASMSQRLLLVVHKNRAERIDGDKMLVGSTTIASLRTNVTMSPVLARVADIYRPSSNPVVRGPKTFMKPSGVRGSLRIEFWNRLPTSNMVTAISPSIIRSPIRLNMIVENQLRIAKLNAMDFNTELIHLRGGKYFVSDFRTLRGPSTSINQLFTKNVNGLNWDTFGRSVLLVDGEQKMPSNLVISGRSSIRTSMIAENYHQRFDRLLRIDRPATINGKAFKLNSPFTVIRNSHLNSINGLRFPADLMTRRTPQTIIGLKRFRSEASFLNPLSIALLNGLRLPLDIVTRNGNDGLILSKLIFMRNASIGGSVIVQQLVDGVNIKSLSNVLRRLEERRLDGPITFKGQVFIPKSLQLQQVNGINLTNLALDSVPVGVNVPIVGRKTFASLTSPSLVARTVNGYSLRHHFVPVNENVVISSIPSIRSRVTSIDRLKTRNELLGRVNVVELLRRRISLSAPQILVGGLRIRRVVVMDPLKVGLINGLRSDSIASSSKAEVIRGTKILTASKVGPVWVRSLRTSALNRIPMNELIKYRVVLDREQLIRAPVSMFNSTIAALRLRRSSRSFSGIDLLRFVRSFLYKTGRQTIRAPKRFPTLTLRGEGTSKEGIGGIHLGDLRKRVIQLSVRTPQVIVGNLITSMPRVGGALRVNGLLNGLNLDTLARSLVKFDGRPLVFPGTTNFSSGFLLNGNLRLDGSLNGLDPLRDILLRHQPQSIPGVWSLWAAHVRGSLSARSVNRLRLSAFDQNVMKTNRANVLHGQVHFGSLRVDGRLESRGLFNGVNVRRLADSCLTKLGSLQVTSTKRLLAGSSFLSTLNVESLNGVPLRPLFADIVHSRDGHIQVISGGKTFLTPIDVTQVLRLTRLRSRILNGVDIRQLAANSINTMVPAQRLAGHFRFLNGIQMPSLTSLGLINGLNFSRDLVHLHIPQTIAGRISFDQVTSLGHIAVEGQVNGLSLPAMIADSFLADRPQTIIGHKIFAGRFGLMGGLTVNTLNSFMPAELVRSSARNIAVTGNWTLLNFDWFQRDLSVRGPVAGVSILALTRDHLLKHVPQTLAMPLNFEKLVFKSDVRLDGPINGLRLGNFLSRNVRFQNFVNATSSAMNQAMVRHLRVASSIHEQLDGHSDFELRGFELTQTLPNVCGHSIESHAPGMLGIAELGPERSNASVHMLRLNGTRWTKRGLTSDSMHSVRRMFWLANQEYIIHQAAPNSESPTTLLSGTHVIAKLGPFVDDVQLLVDETSKEVLFAAMSAVLGSIQLFSLKQMGQAAVFSRIGRLVVGPAVTDFALFETDGQQPHLAVARSFTNLCPTADSGSLLFAWPDRHSRGGSFQLVQRFPIGAASKVVHSAHGGQDYLIFADGDLMIVYRRDVKSVGCEYKRFQDIAFNGLRSVQTFVFGPFGQEELHLLAMSADRVKLWTLSGESGFTERPSNTLFMNRPTAARVQLTADSQLHLLVTSTSDSSGRCDGSAIFTADLNGVQRQLRLTL